MALYPFSKQVSVKGKELWSYGDRDYSPLADFALLIDLYSGIKNQLQSSLGPTQFVASAKHTKKVGIMGNYGTHYGTSLKKMVKKIEITCFWGKTKMRWTVESGTDSCMKTVACGTWTYNNTTSAVTIKCYQKTEGIARPVEAFPLFLSFTLESVQGSSQLEYFRWAKIVHLQNLCKWSSYYKVQKIQVWFSLF